MKHDPNTNPERDQCVSAGSAWLASSSADKGLQALVAAVFSGPAAAWTAARTARGLAASNLAAVTATAKTVAASWNDAFLTCTASVRDRYGRPQPSLAASALENHRPSNVIRLPLADRVRLGRLWAAHAAVRPELAADAVALATLADVTEKLSTAWDACAQATRASHQATADLAQAAERFDAAWPRVVRLLKGGLGDAATDALLPRFSSGRKQAPAKEREAA